MGPPKKKPHKDKYSERLRQLDYFEYRWSDATESYYFFNPYTGETIVNAEAAQMDRARSMWAPIDPIVGTNVHGTTLYPEYFASRRWGRRVFTPYKTRKSAATHINAVARGFLARKALSRYYAGRYAKILCVYSGYYYYYDRYDLRPDADPTWYKPRLAMPWDIGLYHADDPEDYLKGNKYTYMGFEKGPYIRKNGLGRNAVKRSEQHAFIKPSDYRDRALEDTKDIDIDGSTPLGAVIPWMDGIKAQPMEITEYVIMRTAIHNNDWYRVYDQMQRYPHNDQIQFYGMFCFATSFVPLDTLNHTLNEESMLIYNHVLHIITATKSEYSSKFKIFALNVLYNILCTRPGRVEYFNTRNVVVQGEGRQEAIERHQLNMLKRLTKYLERIPMEVMKTSTKGSREFTDTEIPTKSGVDLVEAAILCLAVLAHEQETREIMSEVCIDSLLAAMHTCEHEAQIQINGLRFLYNLCYRCESGQAVVLQRKPKHVIKRIKDNFAGDQSVNVMLRRFELAVVQDGWRGNVEEYIEAEMREDDAQSVAMKTVQGMSDADFEALYAGANEALLGNDNRSTHSSQRGAGEGQGLGDEDQSEVASLPMTAAPAPTGQPGTGIDAGESFISALTQR